MGRALVDSSVLLAVVVLIWLPLRRRMSAQFAHGLFLLVLLKLAMPIPASLALVVGRRASLRRAASGLSNWAVARCLRLCRRPRTRPTEPIVVASVARADRRRRDSGPRPFDAGPIARRDSSHAVAPMKAPTPLSTARAHPDDRLDGLVSTIPAGPIRSDPSLATRRLIHESLPVPDGSGWFQVDFEALRRTAGVRSCRSTGRSARA